MQFKKADLKKLRAKLPPGWKQILADEHQLQPGTIANLLSGIGENDAVILSAISLAEKHKKDIESRLAAL